MSVVLSGKLLRLGCCPQSIPVVENCLHGESLARASRFTVSLLPFLPVFGVEPDLTREGGSIPVTLTFQEATGKNVMLLPVGSADDGAHSQNEKLNR